MARLIRDEEVEIVDGRPIFTYYWGGMGVARMPNTWLWKAGGVGCFTSHRTLTLEDIPLRIIGFDRTIPFSDAYVVRNNYRWPLWWLLLRIWLFLRQIERNLRLTAADGKSSNGNCKADCAAKIIGTMRIGDESPRHSRT